MIENKIERLLDAIKISINYVENNNVGLHEDGLKSSIELINNFKI